MSKRLAYLEKITQEGSADPFHWYCLAQEYRSLEKWNEAVAVFEKLRERNADYIPAYLMCVQTLEKLGRTDDAKSWAKAGMEKAKIKGDSHALSELETALASLG